MCPLVAALQQPSRIRFLLPCRLSPTWDPRKFASSSDSVFNDRFHRRFGSRSGSPAFGAGGARLVVPRRAPVKSFFFESVPRPLGVGTGPITSAVETHASACQGPSLAAPPKEPVSSIRSQGRKDDLVLACRFRTFARLFGQFLVTIQ